MSFKAFAWVSPEQQTILTGAQQAGGEVFGSLLAPSYIVRGYPLANLLAGRPMWVI